MEDKGEQFYEFVKAQGIDVPNSYSEFKTAMQDANTASQFHAFVSSKNIIVPESVGEFQSVFSEEGKPVNFTEGSQEPQEQPSQPSEESGTPSPLVEQELPVGIAAPKGDERNVKAAESVYGDTEEELGSYFARKAKAGVADMTASIYRTPEFIWDVAANAYNLLLEGQDYITGTESVKVPTSDAISDKIGIDNIPAKSLEAYAEKQNEVDSKYNESIITSIQNGDYKTAAISTAGSITESLPFTLSLLIPAAAGASTARTFAATTAVMGAGRKQELVENETLTETQKNTNAAIHGVAEAFEVLLGAGSAGRTIRKVAEDQGVKEAKRFSKDVFENVLKDNPYLQPFSEAIQEGITTYTQNLADIYVNGEEKDVTEGLADAMIVGAVMGGGFSGAAGSVKVAKKILSDTKTEKSKSPIYTKEELTSLEEIAYDEGKYNQLVKEIADMVEVGEITPQEAEALKVNLAETVDAVKAIPTNLSEEQKNKALSLVKEKQSIKRQIEGKDEALVVPQKERINAIDEELISITQPNEEAAVTPTEETTTEGATDKVNKLFDSRVKIATEKFDKAINDVIKESGLPYYEANELKRVTELRAEKDKTISDLESKRSKALKTKLKGAVKKTSVQNDKDVDSLDDLGISDEELLELEDEIGFEEKTSQAPEVLEQGMVSDGGKNYEITSIDNKKDGSKVVKAKEVIEVTEDNIEDLQSNRQAPLKVGDTVKKDGSKVIKAKEVIEVTKDNINELQSKSKTPLKVGDKVEKDGSKVVKAKEVVEGIKVTEDNIEDLQSKRKAPLKVGDKVYGTTKRYIGAVAEQIAKDNAVGVFEEKAPKPPKWKTKGTSKKQEVTTPTKTTSSKAKPTIEERTEEDIEKELEEDIKSIEKDQKDFEQAILDELAAKNRNRDLVSLKENLYQVTRKPDGTFSVSKMRADGKLIGIKSDTTERKAAIAQFKRKQTLAEKSDMTQAEKLVEESRKESEDRILKALDKAIQDTSFTRLRGQANDVVTVLGVTAANLSLRGVRAAYKAGVSLKEAIAIQYAKIKGTGITELEFKRFVLENLKPTSQKKQQQDKDEKETEEAPVVTEETPTEGITEAEKTKIAEEIGKARKVKPKNIKGLLDVMSGIFGLNKKQSESAAVVGDVIVGNAAKRAGISKDEMYQKIAYQKANLEDIKKLSEKGKVLYQIVGENANLTQVIKDDLATARQMEATEDPKTIKIATGWERGADGKWRYETVDNIPFLKDTVRTINKFIVEEGLDNGTGILGGEGKLILPPELLELYPQLKDVEIFFDREMSEYEGSYYPNKNKIVVGLGVRPENTVRVLLHEIQHAIQEIEGFARGGNSGMFDNEMDTLSFGNVNALRSFAKDVAIKNPEKGWDITYGSDAVKKYEEFFGEKPSPTVVTLASVLEQQLSRGIDLDETTVYKTLKNNNLTSFEKYKRLAGEVESRNVEKRMNMTSEQRRASILEETEDVARDEQVVLFEADGSLKQAAPLIFKSTTKEGLSKIQQKAATPEQWVKMITDKGGKGTSQELEWIGLQDYLNEWKKENNAKSVPKEVVEQYINDNQIEIVEVVKRKSVDKEGRNEIQSQFANVLIERGMPVFNAQGEPVTADNFSETDSYFANINAGAIDNTKYSNYTLDGGENYREVLLTLPRKDKITAKLNEDSPYYKWDLFDSSGIKIGSSSKNRESDAIKDVRNPNNYKSSHWDEANILAHLRLNERTLPNGERVMFIEEVQSDWAQEGKKKGFETKEVEEKRKQREEIRLELVEIDKKIEELEARKKSFESLSDTFSSQKELLQEKGRLEKQLETVRNNRDFERIEEGIRNLNKALNYKSDNIQRIDEEIYDLKYGNPKREQLRDRLYEMDNANDGSEAPNMPYKKTDQWVGMAMRRVMQMAAQEGFDRVAWVTGEQSADRYDLSKQIESIYIINDDVNKRVTLMPVDGETINMIVSDDGSILSGDFKGDNLEDVIGKELAEKVVKSPNDKRTKLSGVDLEIGGEGMKTFYNSILPTQAKKEARRFDKKANVDVVDFGGEKTDGWKVDDNNTWKVKDISIKEENNGDDFVVRKGDRVLNSFGSIEDAKEYVDESFYDLFGETEMSKDAASQQLSIAITPEMRMNLNSAVPLFQGARGAMAAADGNYVVYALTDPNISTPLHELAHVYEHYLTDKERADIESWSGHNAGTVEFSEAFARGFEKFLAGGKVNNPKLQKIFENFKEWLTEIYNGITGSEIDIELNDKMKSIYNEMLGATPEKVKSTQTVAQETKGLSEKEKTKQGFIEYTEAIKEKSREKLDAATDKIKKRLDTQVQKLKDFKERKRVITSFANSLLTDLKKSGVKYVPTAKVKTILNLVNSAKTDDSLKTATDKLIQTIRDIAVTDKEVKLKAQRIDNVNQAKKNAKMGKFGNFESAYAILNLKEIPQQFEKEYYDVMSNLGQRGAFEIDVDAVNELYEKISKLPITEDITKEETIGDTTEGKKEITEVKSGTHTSSNPIKIFKGLGGKVDLNGVRINAHEGAEGVFTAVDEDLAKEYAKDKGMSEIILPAGTTFEVVEVDGTGMTPGQYRAAEVKAINNSKADAVKLITVDGRIKAGTKKQEQYVVKNLKLIESKLDITETVAAIDEAKQDLTDENIKELPSDYISDIRQFIKVPTEFLNRYNKQFLKNLEAAVKNAKNGIMTGNAITSVVRDYEASLDAKDIVDNNILEKTAEQAKKVFKGASKIFTKNYYKNRKSKNVPQLVGELSNKYTAYFDSVLGSLKGTPIYEAFNNITSKKSTAESQTNNTKAEFTKKLKSAIRSRIPFIKRMSQVSGEPFFRLSVRSQLYLQQKQFESNRKSKGVQSVDDIIKNIKENLIEYEAAANLTPKEIEIIIDEYNKGAVDGSLSAEKMWADMNSKERDLIKFMRAELDKSGKKSEYINIAFRNNPLPQYKDYFPRSGSTIVTEGFDFFQSLKDGKLGRQSFKTRSSNERARTIDFISFSPFNDFMNHITSVNYDYYLTPEVSRFTSMTGQIGDIANQQETKRVAESMNQIMKATLNTSFNETNKATNSTFSDVLGRSVLGGVTRNLLIKPTRLISEFVFNYLPVVTLKSKSLLKTLPERKAFNKVDALKKIQERFGSVQQSRVGAYKLDMKDLGQGLDKRFNSISSEVKDAAERFIRSNYLTDFSKGASQLFYEITDSAAKPIWEATFLEEFKKESGSEFDAAEFVKDNNEYSDKYKRSIEKAKARADKRTSAIFNTAERMESKLNQQKRTGMKSLFYDFMQSFAYNEAPAIKEAVHSTLGHGAYGRMEGVTTLLALSTRAVGYQVLNAYLFDLASNLVINLISEGKFSFDDEDDEYDLKITDELNKGLASFALLMAIGNKAAWVKGLAAIGANAAYRYGYYPFFTERGKEGKEFDIYQDSPLFSPDISKQGATGFAGGLGILNNESEKLAKATDKFLSKAMPRLAEGDLTLNEAIDIMNESKMSYYAWKSFNKVTGTPMGGMEYPILKGLDNKDNVKPAF